MVDVIGGSEATSGGSSELTSSSSFEDVLAAYVDNCDYEDDGSVAKAKLFRKTCRILLMIYPKRLKQANQQEVETDPRVLQEQLERATDYIAAFSDDSGGQVVHADFQDFRE